MRRPSPPARLALAGLLVALTACSGGGSGSDPAGGRHAPSTTSSGSTLAPAAPGVYAHTGPTDLSPAVAGVPTRVYVPNSESHTVDVIDPATFKVIDHFAVGRAPQHITPSWDLKTLYVDNNEGNSLTPIDPVTGKPGPPIPVDDPYNLYFTPDGAHAIVVAEALRRLDVRDPHTWAVEKSIPAPCDGVDHGDFTADGKQMLLSCEFSGQLLRLDVTRLEFTGTIPVGGSPVDVRLSPDGSVFFVANQKRNGVSVIDLAALKETGFIPAGKGTHGLYPSRDATAFYASNRLDGSVSVINAATHAVTATWTIGGSPDMGGVSTDGTRLWLTGRYHRSVYVIDTRTGELLHTIKVGKGSHGLCLFPQPGRLSLGHTGNFR
ncbi:MAG TPA: YncE family protein [Acidimicrobiia bacterium]|nr:YncE family protein [Acidimicrobiia bacterium]